MTWSLVAKTPPMGQPPVEGDDLTAACDKSGLAFASPQLGWITTFCVSLPDAVLVTRDGGAHWASQLVPLPASVCSGGCDVQAPQFAGPTTFLLVDAYPSAAYLLISGDSGATWTTLRLPPEAGPYPRVKFFDAANGVAVSAGPQGVIAPVFYVTADGGRTWSAVPQGMGFDTATSFDFVSTQLGFAWVAGGRRLLETTDSGRIWGSLTPQLG